MAGDVLFVPTLWWHQRSTATAGKANGAENAETVKNGENAAAAENGAGDDIGVGITVQYQYRAHSSAMLRVAAALREQMSLE